MVTCYRYEKAPDADKQSRADKFGRGVALNVKTFSINSGTLKPPPNDDGELIKSMSGEIVLYTVNGGIEYLMLDSLRSFPECSPSVFLCLSHRRC